MPSQADELAARVQTFADRVLKLIGHLPQNPRFEHIFTQLIDSASSQSANYRAARRARSRKEFVAKIGVVAEEADESENWLEMLTRAGVANTPARITEIASLVVEASELRAIFVQSHQTSRANYQRMCSEPKHQAPNRRRRRADL
jgi:four helix bundle protein